MLAMILNLHRNNLEYDWLVSSIYWSIKYGYIYFLNQACILLICKVQLNDLMIFYILIS